MCGMALSRKEPFLNPLCFSSDNWLKSSVPDNYFFPVSILKVTFWDSGIRIVKIPACFYLKMYTRNTEDTGKILCPRSRVNNNMHDEDNLNVIFLITGTSGGEGSCRCVIQTITVQPMCLRFVTGLGDHGNKAWYLVQHLACHSDKFQARLETGETACQGDNFKLTGEIVPGCSAYWLTPFYWRDS